MPQRWFVAVKLTNHWSLGVWIGGAMASELPWLTVALIGAVGYLLTQALAGMFPQKKGTHGGQA